MAKSYNEQRPVTCRIEENELDALLEKLHKTQSADIFSDSAKRMGWTEHALPIGFSAAVINEIRHHKRMDGMDWRILGLSLGLFSSLAIVIIMSANQSVGSAASYGQNQFVLGLFWAMIGLGLSVGIVSIVVWRYGMKVVAQSTE